MWAGVRARRRASTPLSRRAPPGRRLQRPRHVYRLSGPSECCHMASPPSAGGSPPTSGDSMSNLPAHAGHMPPGSLPPCAQAVDSRTRGAEAPLGPTSDRGPRGQRHDNGRAASSLPCPRPTSRLHAQECVGGRAARVPSEGRGGGGNTSPHRPGPGRATPGRRAASQASRPALTGRVGSAGVALQRLKKASLRQECDRGGGGRSLEVRGLNAPP